MMKAQPLSLVTKQYDSLLSEAAAMSLKRRTYPSARPWKPKYYHSKHVVFSDSILVWSASATGRKNTDFRFGNDFFVTLSIFFALAMKKGFPLRIGVAFGPCVIAPERGLYLGHSIIDAYNTEKVQDWVGVACHPTCFEAPYSTNLHIKDRDGRSVGPLVEYDIPIKADAGHLGLKWTIDWPFWGFTVRVKNALTTSQRKHVKTPFAERWNRALAYYDFRRAGWGEESDSYAERFDSLKPATQE